ncbi:Spo0E family sporulation regulatory protein-aspartic acid phosphatase [Metabacillus sp. Hm71]|uniref:Spo0E family sporulation regulatory protein-aspartic acid phosphatase n=1 Tax=Metabacillus sp. Hm71 TaxID=3450743 RepID=UPI003F42B3BE
MNLIQLQKEIQCLQEQLYQIGKNTDCYSEGEVLKVSQQLDQKIIIYQKQMKRLSDKQRK